jgi:GrpB-like predicted nucleotidyltransferase (UPF0157 family)
MRTIAVVDYDPSWPEAFERLRSHVWAVLSDVAVGIEHVGSTAVPGLAAKPVIDIDIVVRDEVGVASAIGRLATLGYVHRGNLGIEGREAFANPPTGLPEHNLYVCPAGSVALGNHLAVRDYLRAHPGTAQRYGDLKKQLATTCPHDIDSYIDGKTAFILAILRGAGFSDVQLAAIEHANKRAIESIHRMA